MLSRALRYLTYRPRSVAEVRSYLCRLGYPPEAVEVALARLRSLNYLNDESFARQWALSRAQNRGFGPLRIERELQAKGLAQELIRAAVRETFAQENETAQAKRLLDKRFKGQNLQEPKVLRRAAALLKRRGYGAKTIYDLLKYSIDED